MCNNRSWNRQSALSGPRTNIYMCVFGRTDERPPHSTSYRTASQSESLAEQRCGYTRMHMIPNHPPHPPFSSIEGCTAAHLIPYIILIASTKRICANLRSTSRRAVEINSDQLKSSWRVRALEICYLPIVFVRLCERWTVLQTLCLIFELHSILVFMKGWGCRNTDMTSAVLMLKVRSTKLLCLIANRIRVWLQSYIALAIG